MQAELRDTDFPEKERFIRFKENPTSFFNAMNIAQNLKTMMRLMDEKGTFFENEVLRKLSDTYRDSPVYKKVLHPEGKKEIGPKEEESSLATESQEMIAAQAKVKRIPEESIVEPVSSTTEFSTPVNHSS